MLKILKKKISAEKAEHIKTAVSIILWLVLLVASFGLAWYWYDWKLSLILFLILFFQNVDRSLNKKIREHTDKRRREIKSIADDLQKTLEKIKKDRDDNQTTI